MRSLGAATGVLLALAHQCAGHAFMSQPMSRNGHRYYAPGRPETDPQSLGNTPGYGPCGKGSGKDYFHDFSWDASQAAGHQVVRKGGVLQLEMFVTAHHWGHVEYSLCDLDSLALAGKTNEQQDALLWACFNDANNVLVRHPDYEVYDPAPIDTNQPHRWYLPPPKTTSWPPQGWVGAPPAHRFTEGSNPGNSDRRVYRMWFKVPETANCDHDNCLLFFFYYAANSCNGAGYSDYMPGSGFTNPVQVKDWFAANGFAEPPAGDHDGWKKPADKCSDSGADDGAVHNGKRAYDRKVSLGAPERFYNCADVSTVTGLAQAADLPPASSEAWCPAQVCDSGASRAPTVATGAPTDATDGPTEAGATRAPTDATGAPTDATDAPTTTAGPTATVTCGQCASRAVTDSAIPCGACSAEYCHGNGVLACPGDLVYDPALTSAFGGCNFRNQVAGCSSTVTPAPTAATAQPTDSTASPTVATAQPTDATQAPTDAGATPAPTETTSQPTEATAQPTDATRAPTDAGATPAPTETTSQPTEATAQPTDATQAPTTMAPTTAAPSDAATGDACDMCASRAAHAVPATLPCGVCMQKFCQGNHVMSCPAGLILSAAGSCNWPAAEGCPGASFAAARDGAPANAAGGARGVPTPVAALLAVGSAVAGCVAALVLGRVRARRSAAAAEEEGAGLSGLHVECMRGQSMRAGHDFEQVADVKVKPVHDV